MSKEPYFAHLDEARKIVESWPEWKRNIGHRLDPPARIETKGDDAVNNEEIKLGLITTQLDDGTLAVGVAEIGTGRELADLLSCTVKSSALGTTATLEVRVGRVQAQRCTEEQRAASVTQRAAMDQLHSQITDAAATWLREHQDGTVEEFICTLPARDARLIATKLRARWWSEALSIAQGDSQGGAT